eukprot:s324_g12.t1
MCSFPWQKRLSFDPTPPMDSWLIHSFWKQKYVETCQATVKSMTRQRPELRKFRKCSSRKDVGVFKILWRTGYFGISICRDFWSG